MECNRGIDRFTDRPRIVGGARPDAHELEVGIIEVVSSEARAFEVDDCRTGEPYVVLRARVDGLDEIRGRAHRPTVGATMGDEVSGGPEIIDGGAADRVDRVEVIVARDGVGP